MSTRQDHKTREKRQKRRPLTHAMDVLKKGYDVIRPAVYATAAVGGAWLMIHQLRLSPWHHNTLVWVLGLVIAAIGAVGLYKQVTYRMHLRRWLASEDTAEVLEEEPEVRKMVQALPYWYFPRFTAKRRWARNAKRGRGGSSRREAG